MKLTLKHQSRLVLLSIAVMLSQMASAYNFMVGGLCYDQNSDGTSVTVTYQNSTSPTYSNLSGALTIPSSITYMNRNFSVTAIGYGAFQGCTGITSVTIPNTVTTIGDRAFEACSGMTAVTIPNSVTSVGNGAFLNCSGLNRVNITDVAAWCNINFTNKDANPLTNAHNLYLNGSKVTNLSIPSSVSTIGGYAFYGCTPLKTVSFPNTLTQIRLSSFADCSGLTSLSIPSSVTLIGDGAFFGCTALASISVASGNTHYDSRNNCNAIIETSSNELKTGCNNTVIPNTVTVIDYRAFTGCAGLSSITIPNSVTWIGDYVFSGCTGLTSVTIPNSVTTLGVNAFDGCTGLTSVTIGNSLATISNYAFRGCTNMTSLKLGTSLTTINMYAFYGCSSLTSVTIPNSVANIGSNAFNNCNSLNTLTLGSGLTSLDYRAFYSSTGLTTIISRIRDPQAVTFGSQVLPSSIYNTCTVYVPHGKRSVYVTTSPWSSFNNIIDSNPSGDVNADGTVNVTDYVTTVNYVLEKDPQPFIFDEGDIDMNSVITVNDIVGVARLALSFEGAPMLAPALDMTDASLSMEADVIKQNGNYVISLNLSNNIDITALQMDLDLPLGMTLASATLSDRASGSHQVAFNQLKNGNYRLLASSPVCKSFAGNDGAVLTLTLAGEPCGNAHLTAIQLAAPNASSYMVDDMELQLTNTTGIEDARTATACIYNDGSNIVIDSPVDGKAMIVLPNGMNQTVTVTAGSNVFAAPANGIIIVKMGDSTKKLYIK